MELHSPEAATRGVLQKRVLLGQKKNFCFRKCGWREKSSPGRPQVYFFQSTFWRYSLFFFSFFCFFLFLFFCLFVCCFLIDIRLYGRVSDKKMFTRPISGNKTNFFFRLKNLANFTGKRLFWSLFLIKLQGWRSATLSKRDSNTGVFLWNLQNF